MLTTKMIEIRDRATCIPAVAIRMRSDDPIDDRFLWRCGYPRGGDPTTTVVLMRRRAGCLGRGDRAGGSGDLRVMRQPDQSHRCTDDVDRHIARRLAERREVIGITQVELADRLNSVTFQQISKYEGCVNRISSGRLWELSKALGVPVGYFFEGLDA